MNNWFVFQMDVKCAFLNAPLDEEVYVSYPIDFQIDLVKATIKIIKSSGIFSNFHQCVDFIELEDKLQSD